MKRDWPTRELTPHDERLMLGLIEGGLSEAEQREAALLVALRPGLGPMVSAMREDRAHVSALDEPATPEGLTAWALTAYQSQGGFRLTAHEPVGSTPFARWMSAVSRRPLAAAAVVALSAGVIVAVSAVLPRGGSPATGPLAISPDSDEHSNDVVDGVPLRVGDTGEDPSPTIALMTPADNMAGGTADGEPLAAGESSGVGESLGGVELTRVLTLAREGRLVLRVSATRPSRLDAQIRSLAARRDGPGGWTLDARAPEAMSLAIGPAPAPTAPRPDRGPTELAGDAGGWPGVAMGERGPGLSASGRWVCVATSSLSGGTLSSLVSSLARSIGPVEVLEASSRVEGSGPEVGVNPEEVLWWTQPPGSWAWTVRVPVVIDLR